MKLDDNYSTALFFEIAQKLDINLRKNVQSFNFKSDLFEKAILLGKLQVTNTDIIEIRVKNDIRNRVSITKEAFRLLKSISSPHALISFYSQNSKKWRLSLLTTDYSISEGKVITNQSNPKRYSFLLGQNAKIATPTKFLLEKGQLLNYEDLVSRFSIEVVNKDFYESIAVLFTELVGGNRKISKVNYEYKGLLKIGKLEVSTVKRQEFAVRLIGRLLFAWFLKEKKSKNGVPLIPNEIFTVSKNEDKAHYYRKLEMLFFELLNTKQNHRNEYLKNEIYDIVPYLNGGLFSPHETDYYLPNQENSQVMIPNIWFSNLFDVFNSYNFTVDENLSFDIELSIDPEMLGRIFENLLAEINPDTGESARKSTGSFYTPRQIVDYMISQSLFYYLKDNTTLADGKLLTLISPNYGLEDFENLTNTEAEEVIKKLKNIKIIDPACGSGAFPIGILQRIIQIMSVLDPTAEKWYRDALINIPTEFKETISSKYAESGYLYPRKLQIIRESIFGVDIQPIATEISKLRCFLTLIVDEVVEDDKVNRGIEPLPNLEFKFVTANSLIGLDEKFGNRSDLSHNIFEDSSFIEKLENIRKEYFIASGSEREKIQAEYVRTQLEMKMSSSYNVGSKNSRFKKILGWNPFNEDAGEWLDPLWMFGVNKFDIVIQNPPYVSTRKISDEDKEGLMVHYGFVDDLYNHFIHRGFQLLTDKGIQTVISSDTYFTIETKLNLRKKLLNHNIYSIVSLGYNIFETAMVSTAIAFVSNQKSENSEMIFIDAKESTSIRDSKIYRIERKLYKKTINSALFKPDTLNLEIHNKLSTQWINLEKNYGGFISTSKNVSKYEYIIKDYVENISEGDFTLLGLIAEGGQGLATANNGKYVGVLEGTKEASRIQITRLEKLSEINRKFKTKYVLPKTEEEIWVLFDDLKEKYGRDILGQGYLYRIVVRNRLAPLEKISPEEMINGINNLASFVPYDKGDKDGNRWYLENPYYIDWSTENVTELKMNAGKKGKGSSRFQNSHLYFREGFCYSDINSTYLKARIKPISIYDVTSMSFSSKFKKTPNAYIILLINSKFVAEFVRDFLNNTPHFQINDARFLPIPVPSTLQLEEALRLFNLAYNIQKEFFAGMISEHTRNEELNGIQLEVDRFVHSLYLGNDC